MVLCVRNERDKDTYVLDHTSGRSKLPEGGNKSVNTYTDAANVEKEGFRSL